MMKKIFFLAVLFGVLAGCILSTKDMSTIQISPTTTGNNRTPEILTLTPTENLLPTFTEQILPTETQLPTSSPIPLILTPTKSGFAEIQQQCLEMKLDFQPNLLTEGKLIFISELFDTDEDKGTEEGNGVGILTTQGIEAYPQFGFRWSPFGYAISPDHKYLAYVNEENTRLIVINGAGEEVTSQTWQGQWELWWNYSGTLPRWFGNHLVIFSSDVKVPGSVIILDPFTGDYQELAGSFPDIYNPLNENGFQGFWADPTYTVFDTNLTRAAYLHRSNGENSLVLWNLEINSELWKLTNLHTIKVRPVWSPENTRLIAALPIDNNGEHYELFSISRDGQPTQLTSFTTTYPLLNTILGNLEWSPDGRYLSFGLVINQEGEQKTKLMIYDTLENAVIDYCIQGEYLSDTMTEVWSPDSQQLVVAITRFNEERSQVTDIVLVDPDDYIVKLGENWQIVGWMVSDE